MKQMIRRSVLNDALHFISIKNKLSMPLDSNTTTQGGFLLGTDLDTYKYYIKEGICYSALSFHEVVGFGIVLPNEVVRKSNLWGRRRAAGWNININEIEQNNIAYFEQLAFLNGHRKLVLRLAYKMAKVAFEGGAEFILTTTVKEPIKNLASLPFIHVVGGKKIGSIKENYIVVGELVSDIYLISKTAFHQKVQELPYYDLLTS